MANKTSQHILSTSANLLGFCLVVITSLHITDKSRLFLVDEIAITAAILLSVTTLFSFISIRTENPNLEQKLEAIAEVLFVLALLCIILEFVYVLLVVT